MRRNRDSEAMHAKLDTLLAALVSTDNRYIGIERLPDAEIEAMRALRPQAGRRVIRSGPHGAVDMGRSVQAAQRPAAS